MKRVAEALVDCWYGNFTDGVNIIDWKGVKQKIDPFADTLEGRRQADALEDWLINNHWDLWNESRRGYSTSPTGKQHQWRLDRIKWCFEQLEAQDER